MAIEECDHPDTKVQKHICMKSGVERDESLLGPFKLKKALLERKYYIKSKTPNQFICTGLNPMKAVSLFKNYRWHVNPKWQDITCPEPTAESETAANTEK